MIGVILAVPVFLFVLMLQTTVMSTLPLLNGTADLVLLVLLAWSVQERVRSSVEWAAIGGGAGGDHIACPAGGSDRGLSGGSHPGPGASGQNLAIAAGFSVFGHLCGLGDFACIHLGGTAI